MSREQNKMEKKFTFGFLSTVDSPLLPLFLSAALSNRCDDIVVICDRRTPSEENKKRWMERTGGAFENGTEGDFSIYTLGTSLIPFYFVEDHNDDQTISIIDELGIDCLFNAETPRRLNERLINY